MLASVVNRTFCAKLAKIAIRVKKLIKCGSINKQPFVNATASNAVNVARGGIGSKHNAATVATTVAHVSVCNDGTEIAHIFFGEHVTWAWYALKHRKNFLQK